MNDEDLKRRFQSLRESEQSTAPPYQRPAPSAATSAWRWPGLLAGAAAAAAAAWLVFALRAPVPAWNTDWQPRSWAMPTDVLLELPGQELLTELPHFDHPFVDLEPTTQAPPALPRTLRRTPA